jgi:hypothetical protein
VAKVQPNKRKTARAEDSDDDASAPAAKVPRSRVTARAGPKRGKGAGDAPSVPAAAEKESDLLDDDTFIEDLLEEETTKVLGKSAGVCAADSASPTHARQEERACELPSGGKGDKDALLGDARRSVSKHSSQSSAVPDTPQPTSPVNSIAGSPAAARLGESSVQAQQQCTVVGSDSDSDDEDPAEKFARRFRERNAKNKSEQNLQASPLGRMSAVDECASAAASETLPRCANGAASRDAPAVSTSRPSPGQVGGEGTGARKVISIESPSPEARRIRAPMSPRSSVPASAAGGGSEKPVVSLAERRKALLGL